MDRLTVSGPWITEKEIAYVADAARNAWYQKANIYHDKFEKAFAEYIGVRYAIALPSCTSAIHLALLAAGVGEGDEVIVPDITWIASAAPISYVGASPVFADINQKSWCLSVESFKALITPQTKAVIPVNLYGNIPEMDEIISIARQHNIIVIEDAAESIGSEYKGCKAGGFGNVGVFSFHGSKTMTTGEGGMLVTNDEIIFQKCLFLRDHGRSSDGKMFWNHSVAFKYKMSSMQAALGLAQLERIEELVEKKRQIFRWYYEMLKDIKTITLNDEAPFIKNTYWMVTAIIDSKLGFTKENVMDYLAKKNIDPRPFFYPLSSLPAYSSTLEAKKAQKRNLISYGISPYGINLPSGLNLTFDNIKYICSTLVEFVEDRR